MLRTAQSLPLQGLLTLGFDPTRFPVEPPACYRASWQLPGPDFHRQATTSLSLSVHPNGLTSNCLGARKIEASLSQSQFAALLGVSVRTLQGWEQGRKQPGGAARTLLTSARTNPKALLAVADKRRVAAVVPGVCAGRVTGGCDALYCT